MNRYLNLLVLAISLATILSGAAQVIVPSAVLHFVGAEITHTTKHLFAVVGMFMMLFGGLMINNVYSAHRDVSVLWCALQKIGAFIAVSMGVVLGVFSLAAVAVALFDLASGVLFLYYFKVARSRGAVDGSGAATHRTVYRN